jgi:hypothetical protein
MWDTLESVTMVAFLRPGTKPLKMRSAKEIPKSTIPVEEKTVGPIERIHTAIKKAERIRKKQELIYTKERGKRFAKGEKAYEAAGGGQKGSKARFKAMKGEMEQVEFESILKDV